MAQITEKELSALGDLMSMESVLTAKCGEVAATAQDAALKDCYTRLSRRHQQHLDELYANLK